MAKAHAGWEPTRLRQWRCAFGLSLESAGEQLRLICAEHRIVVPAANFQTLWRHEQGEVYPGPHYRRAYCLMYGTDEVDLGFRKPLPNEAIRPVHHDLGDPVLRRDFLRAATTASLLPGHHGSTVPADSAGPPGAPVSDAECVSAVALRMWQGRVDRVSPEELPNEVAAALAERARYGGHSVLRVDSAGCYTFVHPSLLDLFVGEAMFADIAAGRSQQLATAQTSHQTDQVIKDLVSDNPETGRTLQRWMARSPNPVLRVNAAGILAKIGDVAVADDVLVSLRRDSDVRRLYLTAVLARVLGADWSESARMAAELDGPLHPRLGTPHRFGDLARLLAAELTNPRDAAARWCSATLLGRMKARASTAVADALHDAYRGETTRETRLAIGEALAGERLLGTV